MLQQHGVHVFCARMKNGLDLKNAWRLYKELRYQKYDLIHLNYFTPLLRFAVICAIRKQPLLLTRHMTLKYEGPNWYYRFFNRNLIRANDYVLSVSKHVMSEVINEGFAIPNKSFLIYNGIKVDRYKRSNNNQGKFFLHDAINLPHSTLIIGTVRGLDRHHGVDHLILATKYLKDALSDFHICIVGDGDLRREYEFLRRKLGLENVISFLGARTDIPEILHSMDIFIMPSRDETFGIAAVEAMAAGLPVIAYNVGGLPEIIEHGVTGLLVQTRDPKLLADSIIILAKDTDLRKKMGKAGIRNVEQHFNIDRTLEQYMNMYQKILSLDSDIR